MREDDGTSPNTSSKFAPSRASGSSGKEIRVGGWDTTACIGASASGGGAVVVNGKNDRMVVDVAEADAGLSLFFLCFAFFL